MRKIYRAMPFGNSSPFKPLLSLLLLLSLGQTALKAQGPSTALSYDPLEQDFASLPANIGQSITGDFTIEAWVFWRGGAAFQRVFDIGTGTGNYMAFTPSSGFGTN